MKMLTDRSPSICDSSTETLSTCMSRSTSSIGSSQKINNFEHVLELLNVTFKEYRLGITNELKIENVGNVVKHGLQVNTLLDFIHHLSDHPAIITPPSYDGSASMLHITHRQVYTFIEQSFNLEKFNLRRGDRVAICLPDGPCLNLCLLSVIAYCTCVPSNSQLTPDELLNDYRNLKVKAVIVPYEKLMNHAVDPLVITLRKSGLQLIGLKKSADSHFKFTLLEYPVVKYEQINSNGIIMMNDTPSLNQAHDVVMLFQTSGTCGTKKIVPYRLRTLCISTTCTAYSLQVKYSDTTVNMMPLFHVGGLIRNLLTPIFTGGSIIQCQDFDPVKFCDILEIYEASIWYYGVPSMQQAIIHEASMRKMSLEHCGRLKKICNAGGSLSPTFAKQLKAMFTQAVILPSYGMTECLPICAPPVDYGLEREGSSGQIVGPDVAISINGERICDNGKSGHILIRGGPCFDGYDGEDRSITFDSNGWFDTGDIGYLKDGYIYITGRSKDIINRGGEVISPLEIEDVLTTHPKVAQVMVFSVPHEMLQETIGCVIVTRDSHTRPDLRSLRAFLENKLHRSKHPQLLVYMNDIPKNNVDKPLRINFSNRLNLSDITDSSSQLYEAQCPPKGTHINEPITSYPIEWSLEDVVAIVKQHPEVKDCAAYQCNGKRIFTLFVVNYNEPQKDGLAQQIQTYLHSRIHDYMLPTDIVIVQHLPYNQDGSIDALHVKQLFRQYQNRSSDPLILTLCDIFAFVLGMAKDAHTNASKFPADGDFFDYGGDSLKSGFLISQIRSTLGVSLPVSILYEEKCRTPTELAAKCLEKIPHDHPLLTHGYVAFQQNDIGEEFSSANYRKRMSKRPPSGARNPFNFFIMLFQASPIFFLRPLRTAVCWFFFIHTLISLSSWLHSRNTVLLRCVQLVLAIIITAATSEIVFPLIGIFVKWLVIGRYRAGTYPLWGQYYLRWWFVNKMLQLTDIGIFKAHPALYAAYLKLMGATVGENSSVSCDANIGEYDLITIGSDCCIDKSTIRPFVLTLGHMKLSKIIIGDKCVVGLRVNVVAGSVVQAGTALGPQTTTYTREMLSGNGSSANINTVEGKVLRDLCQEALPHPHFMLELLIGWPLVFIAYFVSHIPWIGCFYLMTQQITSFHVASNIGNRLNQILIYFATPKRLSYYLLSLCVRRNVVPVLYIFVVILVKRLVIGEFKAGPRKHDQISLLKHWLMRTLLSKERWTLVATIVGTHYEIISIIYRLLGAQVGKRVYWPGTVINVVEFDLLTIGNDVIFGARTHILCGDGNEYATVKIEDGGMVSDNCVLLPGSSIGRNAILGSGGLLKKHFHLPEGSVWYGSFNGNAVKFRDGDYMEKKTSTNGTSSIIDADKRKKDDVIRPFGRAFYKRKANYFVIPLGLIVLYNVILTMAGTIFWALPILTAVQATVAYIYYSVTDSSGLLFLIFFGAFCFLNIFTVTLALSIEILMKWTLFGRRQRGSYNWDESSYCQRWQLLISFQTILRENILTLIGGSSWIVLFFRAMGCKVGKRVCLYPNDGDPVMSEPDLVVLEDDVAVDRANLICHMNTFGEFTINPIRVCAGSVLQNDSRLAAGASMLEDCILLDRSYIIPGEVADANSVWQGYPAIRTSIEEQYLIYREKIKVV